MESTTSPSAEGSRPSSPSSQASSSTTTSLGRTSRTRGRDANLYDAVAGRITLNGALADASPDPGSLPPLHHPPSSNSSKRRLHSTASRYSLRDARLAPEEALFRRRRAPVRYAEHDIYWADEDLPTEGGDVRLPESGLLKAVHGYAAQFYEGVAVRVGSGRRDDGGGGRGEGGEGGGGDGVVVGGTRRLIDERSMDETALLAFGVLLEEAGREALGRRGDMVFTEPETNAMVKGLAGCADRAGAESSNVTLPSSASYGGTSSPAYAASSSHHHGRGAKRRKVAATEEREVGRQKQAP